MNSWLIQIKREFWEHYTTFVIMPLVLAALVVIVGIYIVIMHASPESDFGMGVFGHMYQYEQEAAAAAEGPNVDEPVEYIINFTTGELTVAEDTEDQVPEPGTMLNSTLYGIYILFASIMGIILLVYLLGCLHTDRKDRSVLFWKSLPVAETRNVAVKLVTASLVVPLLVTLVSWAAQISYLLLAMLFTYRLGSAAWPEVWSQADILSVFVEQLKLLVWSAMWYLPLNAWWLFSSALGKRSPFLVATIPFVVVIVMENLLFGTEYVGTLLLNHLKTSQAQLQNIMGQEGQLELAAGSVNFFLNYGEMITGFVAAALLLPAAVWLRNHRFEI